ncbi:MAG: hypothetical protein AAF585_08450 [Verrucomicrobiota bacterium]
MQDPEIRKSPFILWREFTHWSHFLTTTQVYGVLRRMMEGHRRKVFRVDLHPANQIALW